MAHRVEMGSSKFKLVESSLTKNSKGKCTGCVFKGKVIDKVGGILPSSLCQKKISWANSKINDGEYSCTNWI